MLVEEDNILSKKMPQTLGLFVIEISLLSQVQNGTEDKLFFVFFLIPGLRRCIFCLPKRSAKVTQDL